MGGVLAPPWPVSPCPADLGSIIVLPSCRSPTLSSEPRAGHSFASEDEADDSLTFETRPVGDTCGSRKPLKRKAGVVLSAFTPACRRGNIALPIRRRRDYL